MTEEEYRNTPKERCFAPTIYINSPTSYFKEPTCTVFELSAHGVLNSVYENFFIAASNEKADGRTEMAVARENNKRVNTI